MDAAGGRALVFEEVLGGEGEVGVKGLRVAFCGVELIGRAHARDCGLEIVRVVRRILREGQVVKERPARGEGAVRKIRGAGAAGRGRGGGRVVGVIRLGVFLGAARAQPQGQVVGHILILVAADVEGVGLPAVLRGDGSVHGSVAEEDLAVVFVLGNAFDDDVFAVAGEDEGDTAAVYVVREYGDLQLIKPVLLDDDLTGGADALRRHHLLGEHIEAVADAAPDVGGHVVIDVGEPHGGRSERRAVDVVGAGIGGHVLLEAGGGHYAVETVGGGGAVARHQRPARRRTGAHGGGAEVEPAVGGAQGHRARAHRRVARGEGEDFVLVVLCRIVHIVLPCGADLAVCGELFGASLVERRLRRFRSDVVAVDLLEHDVVEEGVARGQTVTVVGAIFAETQIEGERGRGGRRAFDVQGVGLPFAFGVDAAYLGIACGGNVYPRAGDVVHVFGARDVVGEHVHGELVVGARLDGEGLGGVAVGGGTEIILVVFGSVLGGHIDHEDVVHRVFGVGEVSALSAVRDKTVVEGLARAVRGAVVTPQLAACGVERLFEADCTRGHVARHRGRGVELRARPIRHGVGIVARRADDFEVGVADEQPFRGFDRHVVFAGGVVVARRKRGSGEGDREDHEQNQDGKSFSFHSVLYNSCVDSFSHARHARS